MQKRVDSLPAQDNNSNRQKDEQAAPTENPKKKSTRKNSRISTKTRSPATIHMKKKQSKGIKFEIGHNTSTSNKIKISQNSEITQITPPSHLPSNRDYKSMKSTPILNTPVTYSFNFDSACPINQDLSPTHLPIKKNIHNNCHDNDDDKSVNSKMISDNSEIGFENNDCFEGTGLSQSEKNIGNDPRFKLDAKLQLAIVDFQHIQHKDLYFLFYNNQEFDEIIKLAYEEKQKLSKLIMAINEFLEMSKRSVDMITNGKRTANKPTGNQKSIEALPQESENQKSHSLKSKSRLTRPLKKTSRQMLDMPSELLDGIDKETINDLNYVLNSMKKLSRQSKLYKQTHQQKKLGPWAENYMHQNSDDFNSIKAEGIKKSNKHYVSKFSMNNSPLSVPSLKSIYKGINMDVTESPDDRSPNSTKKSDPKRSPEIKTPSKRKFSYGLSENDSNNKILRQGEYFMQGNQDIIQEKEEDFNTKSNMIPNSSNTDKTQTFRPNVRNVDNIESENSEDSIKEQIPTSKQNLEQLFNRKTGNDPSMPSTSRIYITPKNKYYKHNNKTHDRPNNKDSLEKLEEKKSESFLSDDASRSLDMDKSILMEISDENYYNSANTKGGFRLFFDDQILKSNLELNDIDFRKTKRLNTENSKNSQKKQECFNNSFQKDKNLEYHNFKSDEFISPMGVIANDSDKLCPWTEKVLQGVTLLPKKKKIGNVKIISGSQTHREGHTQSMKGDLTSQTPLGRPQTARNYSGNIIPTEDGLTEKMKSSCTNLTNDCDNTQQQSNFNGEKLTDYLKKIRKDKNCNNCNRKKSKFEVKGQATTTKVNLTTGNDSHDNNETIIEDELSILNKQQKSNTLTNKQVCLEKTTMVRKSFLVDKSDSQNIQNYFKNVNSKNKLIKAKNPQNSMKASIILSLKKEIDNINKNFEGVDNNNKDKRIISGKQPASLVNKKNLDSKRFMSADGSQKKRNVQVVDEDNKFVLDRSGTGRIGSGLDFSGTCSLDTGVRKDDRDLKDFVKGKNDGCVGFVDLHPYLLPNVTKE